MFLFYSLLLLLYTSASLGQIEFKEANDSTFLLPARNIETIVFSVTVKDAKYDNISRRAKLNGWKNKTNNWTTTKRWNIVFGQNRRWLSRSEVVCLFFHFNGCYQWYFLQLRFFIGCPESVLLFIFLQNSWKLRRRSKDSREVDGSPFLEVLTVIVLKNNDADISSFWLLMNHLFGGLMILLHL